MRRPVRSAVGLRPRRHHSHHEPAPRRHLSVYGQPTSLGTIAASSVVLSPGFFCIEADDIGNPGDLNNDGLVNGVDLAIVLSNWGICGSGACPADIDRDGLVNGVDLAIVLSNWG